MNSIYLTIYLVYHIVFCPVGMFQVVYLDSNTFIAIWCQTVKSPSVDDGSIGYFFPSGRKESFGILQNTVVCLLASGSGGKLTKSIETLLLCEKNELFYLYFVDLMSIL